MSRGIIHRLLWPRFEYYRSLTPSEIKVLSTDQLRALMRAAEENQWSATGRPVWLERHADSVLSILLNVFGREGTTAYRCLTTVILDDGSGGRFTVDVRTNDFHALKDLSRVQLVTAAHEYLARFPHVDLEVDERYGPQSD